MYDKNAAFEPVWNPKRYPRLQPEVVGSWRLVLDSDEGPVGVIFTDVRETAGVYWVTMTDAVKTLDTHFKDAALAETPPNMAYINAQSKSGIEFGDEQRGPLQGVYDAIEDMKLARS